MKQYLLSMLTIACFYYAAGQEDQLIIHEATKINRQLVPRQVMDSLHKIFPHTVAIEYYSMPPAAARNGWAVPVDSLVAYTDTADYYLIVNKKGDIKFYSLFAANGALLMTKLKEDVTYLPGLVKESMKDIQADYPGYKVRSAICYRNENRSRHLYYEVIAERGINQQRFFYDPAGTLVKIDIIRRNER